LKEEKRCKPKAKEIYYSSRKLPKSRKRDAHPDTESL
jgi:hypothetical protein